MFRLATSCYHFVVRIMPAVVAVRTPFLPFALVARTYLLFALIASVFKKDVLAPIIS